MPAKIKDEIWNEIVEYIKGGLTRKDVFELAGISNYSFYDKLKKDSNYYNTIKKAEVSFKQHHLDKIRSDKTWQSSAWLLERKFKDEFARLEKIESKEVDEFANMTDEELDKELIELEQISKNKKVKDIKSETDKVGS